MQWDALSGYAYNFEAPLANTQAYLAYRKNYLLQLRYQVAEYAKQIEEALTAIDHAEAQLSRMAKP